MKYGLFLVVILCLVALFFAGEWDANSIAAHDPAGFREQLNPTTQKASAFAVSAKVSSFSSTVGPVNTSKIEVREVTGGGTGSIGNKNIIHDVDGAPARQTSVPMPITSLSFDGLSNFDNIAAYNAFIIPPDTVGDVGPDHYVQAANSLVRIFDKNGSALTPPFKMSQLFAPLGTPCSSRNDGEPIVLYDPLADRWLISQYCTNFPPFRQMIAISKSSDPLGEYFLYEYAMPNIKLNDFAKFGVWPDGYYMSTEEFIVRAFPSTRARSCRPRESGARSSTPCAGS